MLNIVNWFLNLNNYKIRKIHQSSESKLDLRSKNRVIGRVGETENLKAEQIDKIYCEKKTVNRVQLQSNSSFLLFRSKQTEVWLTELNRYSIGNPF